MPHDPILHLLGLAKKGRTAGDRRGTGGRGRPGPPGPRAPAGGGRRPQYGAAAAHFGEAGGALWLQMPFTKAELGEQLGRSSCAMLAVTDFGFAAALAEKLAARDEERYGPAAQQLRAKADRALMRQREKRQHEKNMRQGKHKPWAAPALSPQQEGRGPADNVQAGAGQRRLRQTAGQAGDGTGRAPRTFPGKPGPGGRKLTAKPRSGQGRNPAGKP